MAKFILKDVSVLVNGIDLSDHVKHVELNIDAAEVDVTAMGNSGYASYLAGMKKWHCIVTFFNDFAAGSVYATIFAQIGNLVPIILRPVKGTVISATNPEFRGNATVLSMQALTGTVNAAAEAAVHLAGNDALVAAIV
jgi:hypothetical protein